jgi:hypothetical protein
MAVACICFALVGCGAGLYAGFGDFLCASVASFLPVFASHYTLLVCGCHCAAKLGWPAEATVWAGDAVVGCWGLGLFWHVTRR